METTTIDKINNMCTWDLQRLATCFTWYSENIDDGMEISYQWIWYNSQSWYAYIALENWVTICEAFNWLEFLVTNMEDGEEFFFDNYEDAEKKYLEINN